MDSGNGMMMPYESEIHALEAKVKNPKAGGIFEVGEILEIKGSRFKIKEITPFGIKLKVLKRD